jgi:hypothetical protein
LKANPERRKTSPASSSGSAPACASAKRAIAVDPVFPKISAIPKSVNEEAKAPVRKYFRPASDDASERLKYAARM